jgi:NOL1/NOP2/fmu family ribosome biogenesis protein
MFRKMPDAIREWTAHKPESCMILQRDILRYCADMLKPGGRMIYSTCTFEPCENEGMIDEFLKSHEDFFIRPVHFASVISRAKPKWGGGREELSYAVRIWPHKQKGEGHFLCALERSGDAKNAAGFRRVVTAAPQCFQNFCDTFLTRRFEGVFTRHANALYLVPDGLPDLSGIRFARSGWYLGDIKSSGKAERFEPSQAFAMGIYKEDAKYSVSFSIDDLNLSRYLRGESFDINSSSKLTAAPGWTLVCLDDYPLGWGKMQNGRLKNKYLKFWIDQ